MKIDNSIIKVRLGNSPFKSIYKGEERLWGKEIEINKLKGY